MLIQYIIDEPPKNTSNGRGNWILHLKEKQSLKQGGAIESAFDWDTKSQLRIHFHRFAAANRPMDDDGLAIAFKPVRDGLIDSLSQHFGQKFDDGNQSEENLGMAIANPRFNGAKMSSSRGSRGSNILNDQDHTVNFTIHPASGGFVIESSYYDDKVDQFKRSLHIITSQEDFSEELGKAVFMDILKRR